MVFVMKLKKISEISTQTKLSQKISKDLKENMGCVE
jgi:hypothetical protein